MKTSTRRQNAQKNHEGSRSALHALKRSFTTFSIALLMFSSAEAAPGQSSLNLEYMVRDAEALYAVTTASGDLKVVNKGPGRALVRWINPLTGAEDQQVLKDEEVLMRNGQLGTWVSKGTLVVIESLATDVLQRGFAVLPTAPSVVTAALSVHGMGFLPWHRGVRLNLDGTLTAPSTEATILRMGSSGPSTDLGFFSRGLHNNGAFAPTNAPQVLEFAAALLGSSSVTGGSGCSIVSWEPSVDTFQHMDSNGDGEITLRLCEDGFTVAVYDEVALEFVIGVPSCPELNGHVVGSILAPYLQGQPSGTLMTLSSAWIPHCSAGAALHGTLHCMVLELLGAP